MADTGQEISNAVANVVDSPSDHHLQGQIFLSDMQIPSISQPNTLMEQYLNCFVNSDQNFFGHLFDMEMFYNMT